ncbi:MAG: polymer-forming cytoskeletal family protein [Gammaproteobacteria bacterium]|jgi:cytoskeletal protein CcmA (bactofilin family)|nr:polymer-forming cytoskeletal family protein [Gammaproteobacteria bacterium]
MGIINRGRPDGGSHAGTTVIAAGSKLVGDLALSDNLHVDGCIEGTIRSEAEVAIGQEGRIEGDLQADHIMISGKFEGNIDAKRLEIVAGGRVDGDVTVAELVIEPGATFNGNSRIREAQAEARQAAGGKKAAPEAPAEKKPQPTPEAKTG